MASGTNIAQIVMNGGSNCINKPHAKIVDNPSRLRLERKRIALNMIGRCPNDAENVGNANARSVSELAYCCAVIRDFFDYNKRKGAKNENSFPLQNHARAGLG